MTLLNSFQDVRLVDSFICSFSQCLLSASQFPVTVLELELQKQIKPSVLKKIKHKALNHYSQYNALGPLQNIQNVFTGTAWRDSTYPKEVRKVWHNFENRILRNQQNLGRQMKKSEIIPDKKNSMNKCTEVCQVKWYIARIAGSLAWLGRSHIEAMMKMESP